MIALSAPSTFDVEIPLPSSKSESNRALIMQGLSGNQIQLENLATARDTQTMMRLLESEGHVLDVIDAGTTMRFLTAYCAAVGRDQILTGTPRMCKRPIGILVEALRGLGASIEYWKQDGYPPLHVVSKGRLKGGELRMRGDVSSQFISAVLMIAPVLAKGLSLELEGDITSRPYIEMTLGLMRKFGIQSSWTDQTIVVSEQSYQPGQYRIESDWSAASYWYSVVALADQASVMLTGLRQESFQGDQKVSELMQAFGVETQYMTEGIRLTKVKSPSEAIPSTIDFTEVPDLAQTLAVVAAAKGHPLTLTGLHTLRVKETDRIDAVATELGKMGVDVSTGPDYLRIHDGIKGDAAQIHTYEDHRMAMAFAPLAVRYPGMIIDEPEVVVKSYPEYWDHLRLAGFTTETLDG